MDTNRICPFSKAIIGQWSRCHYARLADRCSGKMICSAGDDVGRLCQSLDGILQLRSRFIIGPSGRSGALTHAQLMKIRCGGLHGMQRVLRQNDDNLPVIPELIIAALQRHGALQSFPYDEIIQDIRQFNLRKKSSVVQELNMD